MAMNSPNELSFLPEDYLEQKARRRANILCGAVVAIVAGGIGSAFVTTQKSLRAEEKRYAEVDAKYTEAARRIAQVQQMHDQQRQVVHHAELAASLVEKVPRSNMLAEITNSLPSGVSLLDLAMESKEHQEAAPTNMSAFDQRRLEAEAKLKAASDPLGLGAKPVQYDVHLKMTGLAQTDVQVAQLITRLTHNTVFQDVNLVYSEVFVQGNQSQDKHQQQGGELRKFQLEMMLNPQAELRDGNGTKTAATDLSK